MKLNYKNTFFTGLAFMSICAFWQAYDGIIPLILKNTFGIGDTVSGLIMSFDNILALFMLPLFGSLSDRTHTKIGKRMPFIMAGTFSAVLFIVLIPYANAIKSLSLFIISLLLVLISMATYRSPAVALMPDITPKPLRSSANAIINLMGAIGGAIALLLISLLVPKQLHPSYFPLFICIAIIMILSVTLLFLLVKENTLTIHEEKAPTKQSPSVQAKLPKPVFRSLLFLLFAVALWFMGYNSVITAFSKYAQVVWGMSGGSFASCLLVGTIAAILSYIPIGILSNKLGRKKVILMGLCILLGCYLSQLIFKDFGFHLYIMFAFTGFAWAAINVNSYPMVVEMSNGADIGKYTGYYYTFSMSAQIITPILSGFLLEYVSYSTLFPYAAICIVGAILIFINVKHGDNKPTINQQID